MLKQKRRSSSRKPRDVDPKKLEHVPIERNNSPARRIVTREMIARRESFIAEAFVQGYSSGHIYNLARQQLGIGTAMARTILDRVRARWAADQESDRPLWKMQQIERLTRWIRAASKDKRWSAVATLERVLGEVQGTFEPVRVRVEAVIAVAGVQVLSRMSPEEIEALATEYDTLEQRALTVAAGDG